MDYNSERCQYLTTPDCHAKTNRKAIRSLLPKALSQPEAISELVAFKIPDFARIQKQRFVILG